MSETIERAPAIFFGHGSPMNALGGPYAEEWAALGQRLTKPKAVLMVSAHWYIDETAVTAMARPRTIHDFHGFPQPLYDISYPAPGEVWLAEQVRHLLSPLPVRADHDWGLDHGAWSVLTHVFPQADVPIVQLSIDRTKPAAFHYELGKKLAALRDQGVLFAGSGDVVHNLRIIKREPDAPPYDWAARFNDFVKAQIEEHEHEKLIGYDAQGEDARLSIPTAEHYLPLLYVLGAQGEDERASFFTDKIELAAISMTGVGFGANLAV